MAGCGDCWSEGVATDCRIAGTLQGRFADGTDFSNQAPGLDATCLPRSFMFGSQRFAGGREQVLGLQDLVAGLRFDVRPTFITDGSGTVRLDLPLTVRNAPLGPSEIDLDDSRALIEGWSGLQGHLSVITLSEDCSHGIYYCLIELHATLALTAVATDGSTVSLTAAMFDVQDTYSREPTACAVVGE